MKSLFNYIVEPVGDRYSNTKKVGDVDLIINTEVSNHQFINRKAKVIATPACQLEESEVKIGDEVIVHHNVFRRWYDVRGNEKNSRSFVDESTYLVQPDQLFLHKTDGEWKCPNGYCFVQPIKDTRRLSINTERPLVGKVIYSDGTVDEGDLVGFRPDSEFEFIIEGKRLYRVWSHFITIKYEYQGDEEEYNPSWAQSG